MSALGQSRPRQVKPHDRAVPLRSKSGHCPKSIALCRFVPIGDISTAANDVRDYSGSLNQLVGAQQDRGRQLDSDLPSGTQIDHQLEFSGLLDRQLRSVRAFEYLVDISRGAPPQIDLIRSVAHQPPGFGDGPEFGHHGYAFLPGKFDDARALGLNQRIVHCDEGLRISLLCSLETGIERASVAYGDRLHRDAQCRGRKFHFLELQAMTGRVGIPEHGDADEIWRELLQQLEPLSALFGCDQGKPRHIAARPREAGDVTCAQRITDSRHDNGNAAGCLACGLNRLRGVRDDYVDICLYQLSCEPGQPFGLVIGKAKFEGNVAPLGPSQFLQALLERGEPALPFRIIFGKPLQYSDAPHSLALLRACQERPCDRPAAEKRDELAAPHSITSSAITSSLSCRTRASPRLGRSVYPMVNLMRRGRQVFGDDLNRSESMAGCALQNG